MVAEKKHVYTCRALGTLDLLAADMQESLHCEVEFLNTEPLRGAQYTPPAGETVQVFWISASKNLGAALGRPV
jgi:hypothetical protein